MGTQGIQGIAGAVAAQGATGTQGTPGTQRTTGAQGTTGTQGTQGTQGTTGTQGTQGIQGITGTQGTQGITGTQGTQGIQGVDGSFGGATFDYTFATSIVEADPGAGKVRLDDTTQNASTALIISEDDDNGNDNDIFLKRVYFDDADSIIIPIGSLIQQFIDQSLDYNGFTLKLSGGGYNFNKLDFYRYSESVDSIFNPRIEIMYSK